MEIVDFTVQVLQQMAGEAKLPCPSFPGGNSMPFSICELVCARMNSRVYHVCITSKL